MAVRSVMGMGFDGAVLVRAVRALALAWQRRRMVGRLGALDDRLLADIGITRQDVLSVLAEPLFVDPSEKLAERARATRTGRRFTGLEALRLERGIEVDPGTEPRRAA